MLTVYTSRIIRVKQLKQLLYTYNVYPAIQSIIITAVVLEPSPNLFTFDFKDVKGNTIWSLYFFVGPRPDWDPDIVEALDEDFDFDNPDNQLDDDFMEIANAEKAEKKE